mgnify:CR=1 FL=1
MTTRPYFFGIGKRKSAIANVKLFSDGTGEVKVNGMKPKEYFHSPFQIENSMAPLALTNSKGSFDVEVTLTGGGIASQSDAMRHGISRALLLVNPDHRHDLKHAGFLRRDARIKERKKPGLKRARRAPQFSKR